ncbi:ABC transporter ATP-binding protein, partial [Saccharothrix sp. ST-888]|uniref:ABC transporter ATP-binding protein n=1 Tax=Saccharothrix sp. ST-888 TaxID=1427391 RepID=UPI000B140A02
GIYLGKSVEIADRESLYRDPMHPYSKALTSPAPVPEPARKQRTERMLLTADVPSPITPPSARRSSPCWMSGAKSCEVTIHSSLRRDPGVPRAPGAAPTARGRPTGCPVNP